MWQPDSFWERQPGTATLVHVMAPLPPVSRAAAVAAEVRPSITSQLAHNPVGVVSALAHRSARRLWWSPSATLIPQTSVDALLVCALIVSHALVCAICDTILVSGSGV